MLTFVLPGVLLHVPPRVFDMHFISDLLEMKIKNLVILKEEFVDVLHISNVQSLSHMVIEKNKIPYFPE